MTSISGPYKLHSINGPYKLHSISGPYKLHSISVPISGPYKPHFFSVVHISYTLSVVHISYVHNNVIRIFLTLLTVFLASSNVRSLQLLDGMKSFGHINTSFSSVKR